MASKGTNSPDVCQKPDCFPTVGSLLVARLCFAALLVVQCDGFIWKVNERLQPNVQLMFTEKHMFGSNQGPYLMTNGDSFMKIDAKIKI